jgi:hypothetical protein
MAVTAKPRLDVERIRADFPFLEELVNGRPVAVLIGVEDEEELERLVLGYSPKFRTLLEAARQQIRDTGGIEHEEFWTQVEAEEDE